jgi:nanoRNase/pAp phosphatase (c-di-AMP/oligoRNAs hydrolase)
MAATEKLAEKYRRLCELLRGRPSMLIVMQDNPDPDAIAAAVALREVANKAAGVSCSLAHGGTIGRGENRALVEYLNLSLRPLTQIDPGGFAVLAMVDTQPGSGNNSLPEGIAPHVVIDHHTQRNATRSVRFTDVRSRYGATSTILYEYLQAGSIPIEAPLATALLYGIRSDTQDFGREATKADMQAIDELYPLANKRMLGQIQRGRVPGSYYQLLAVALSNAKLHPPAVVTDLGDLDNPDMVGEVADLLLRHEAADWSMCYGFYAGKALLSIRSLPRAKSAEEVVRSVVSRIGTGGGHANSAGGQVPLKRDSAERRRQIGEKLRGRFLRALGADPEDGTPLVRPRSVTKPAKL